MSEEQEQPIDELEEQRRKRLELETYKTMERLRKQREAKEKLALADLERERQEFKTEWDRKQAAQRKLIAAARANPFDYVDGKLNLDDFME
jgi:hypothetical protein